MHRLPFIGILVSWTILLWGQSPHGDSFVMDCADCHSTGSWEIEIDTFHFNHDTFGFALEGMHELIDCKSCHVSLIFDEAPNDCASCHQDVHSMTVGNDCARCHNANSWLVDDIPALHEEAGFPLTGVHSALSCNECHAAMSELRFEPLGNQCINCHRADFESTTAPDHEALGLSMNCTDCHDRFTPDWHTDAIDHDFFPLTGGHDIQDCNSCHNPADYSDISSDCISCHLDDFEQTVSPNHRAADFSQDCATCHTTDPDWKPAEFSTHDVFFPIYSGEHAGEWSACLDCHINAQDYTLFQCINCHTNPETDEEHEGVSGYTYDDAACLACHPNGSSDITFDHSATDFPLTGAHIGVECLACHDAGFEGTSTLCADCHTEDFNSTINPNHQSLGLTNDCATCHTTDPGWIPAGFDVHDDFYPLTGAHATIANDCIACHDGDYVNTPNTCVGCHLEEFNNTTDPDHVTAQFSQDCAFCHDESAWIPATFDHDAQFFPIYSGAHAGEWAECIDCHTSPGNYSVFSCTNCHMNPETDEGHIGVTGYVYSDNACLACHPTGNVDDIFDHSATDFPLTGAHMGVECLACHSSGFEGTSTVCADCHTQDFNSTTNPDHQSIGLSMDCASCHTTDPGWMPAGFDVHDDFYPLVGAHASIANDCIACHDGDYVNTPNTCVGCHLEEFNNTTDPDHSDAQFSQDCAQCHDQSAWIPSSFDHDVFYPLDGAHASIADDCLACHDAGYINTPNTCVGCHLEDFNNTTDPNHVTAQFSQDCAQCHDESAWVPATFDHDAQFFPIYSGSHAGEWAECVDCHTIPGNYGMFSCTNCHMNPETDEEHLGVSGYAFNDQACLACHPTGEADVIFDHDATDFPLTGGHMGVECLDCHSSGFEGTSTVCADCHTQDFNSTTNPDHQSVGLSMDCATCHTTDPGWMPAEFDVHDDFYPLVGAHASIANDCIACHNGDYVNTPTDCMGCHLDDYNNASNPDHVAAQFSQDCAQCHDESAWVPATFDHDGQYFPIYSGAHEGTWTECTECHTTPGNFAAFSCINCHMNPETDEEHIGVNGYFYDDNACLACHPDGSADMPFSHDNTGFPLTGAHLNVNCIDCHPNGFQGTSPECVSCHQGDFDNSTNPDHQSLNFPTDCTSCHTTDPGWMPAGFDIHDDYYPLTGAHAAISGDCAICHNGDYNNTPNTCDGCHMPDYNNSTNPDHQSLNIPTDCATCHTTDPGWMPAGFDIHDDYYPLTGAHAAISGDCAICHNGDYNNTPNTCDGCHMPDYNNSTNPDHQSLNLPTDCATCHTTEPGWMPAGFDIHDQYWPLNGAHGNIANDCVACHNGDYNNTPNTCFGCHLDDYNSTTNPDHQAANISTNCTDCHTEGAWIPSTFDHSTFWPLNGAHAAIANDCNACHMGNYTNTPNTCVGCHIDDYNSTTNPDHQDANLSTDCTECHTEDAWIPSTFDHSTFWPLNGAHAAIANDCNACHMGNYTNTPNTCVGCHVDDYNSTTNPDHQSAQFPMDCTQCHDETAWVPSTFEHDNMYFPIYSGEHEGEWNQCTECHTTPGDFTVFSCIDCHEHNDPADLADEHEDVSGYSYSSPACYSCHPTGEE